MSERIGRLCEKHGEWCPSGWCRWCGPTIKPVSDEESTYREYVEWALRNAGLVFGPTTLEQAVAAIIGDELTP